MSRESQKKKKERKNYNCRDTCGIFLCCSRLFVSFLFLARNTCVFTSRPLMLVSVETHTSLRHLLLTSDSNSNPSGIIRDCTCILAHTRIRRLGVPYLATDAFAREARGIATCAHERKASLVPGKRRARTRAVVSIADVIAGRISYAQSAVRPDILTLATGAAEKTWEGGGVGGEINAFFFSDDEGGGGGDRESAALAGPVGRR